MKIVMFLSLGLRKCFKSFFFWDCFLEDSEL